MQALSSQQSAFSSQQFFSEIPNEVRDPYCDDEVPVVIFGMCMVARPGLVRMKRNVRSWDRQDYMDPSLRSGFQKGLSADC